MYQQIYDRCQALTLKGKQCRNLVYGRYGITGKYCTQHEHLINGRRRS